MKIKPLTSLRFFFALMVFLRHTGSLFSHEQFRATQSDFFTGLYNNFFYEGFVGVNFFFMLSGFILALNYKGRLLSGKINFKEFWVARVARIYPLHLFTLLLAIPFSLKGMAAAKSFWLTKLLLNIFLLQSFVPDPDVYFSWNVTAWSISDEMFFYFLFPFIIIACFRFKKSFNLVLLMLVLLVPAAIYFTPRTLTYHLFYINPVFRIVDFALGILVYNIYEKINFNSFFKARYAATFTELFAIGLFCLFFGFHNTVQEGYRYSFYYWLPIAFIIFVFMHQAGYVSKLLSAKALVIGGEISFSFYLLHHLVIRYISYANSKLFMIHHAYKLIIVIFLVAAVASYLCYRYIEMPSNNFIKAKFRLRSNFAAQVKLA